MSSAAQGTSRTGADPPPVAGSREGSARAAAAEPFAAPADPRPEPALIQAMWWDWVHGHPRQLAHEKLFLFLQLDGVAPEAAEAAVRALVAGHDTLRSRFAWDGGRLRATVNDAADFRVEVLRLAEGEDVGAAFEAERLRFSAPELPIDSPWLARTRIVAGGESVLVCLVFHHMVFDARSRLLVEKELRERLAPGADPAAMHPRASQYLDYAAWERNWLERSGGALAGYWRDWLGAVPALRNPGGGVLRWRPGHKVHYDVQLDDRAVERLRAVAAGATLFRLLLGASALAVARWSGQARFVLRVVGDLRTTRPMDDMIGNLVCTDLVAVEVPADPHIPTLLAAVAAGYRHATELRCPNLLGLPGSGRFPDAEGEDSIGAKTAFTLNYMPLFKFRGDGPPPPGALGAAAPPIPTRSAARDHWPTPVCPINLRIWDWGGRLVCRMEFDDDVIAESDQRALVDRFIQAVEDLPAGAGG